jgi:site-specific recombinase XerD
MTTIAATVQAFFTERLITQRQASPHTITAYRDTMRMLLAFTSDRTRTPCHRLQFSDLNAATVSAFLDHLEHDRDNSVRTRNARLAAIHSLFGFAALRHPEHAADIARVLAIPAKRGDHTIITYLTDIEAQALLNAPDHTTRTGRRDHAILALAVQTGLRASELTTLTRNDIHLDTAAHVACRGKGRKHRITPLTNGTVAILRTWLTKTPGADTDPLFPTNRAGPLTLVPSPNASPSMPPPRQHRAPPWPANTSLRTYCATPPPCDCYTPGSTPPSSHYGSATKTSPPQGSTCKPTSNSNSEHSTGPHP